MLTMKKIIGITGGIASGKSTVTNYLIEKGYKVIDADKIAKDIVLPGRKANKLIELAFGSSYFNNQVLDRKKLAEVIFHSDEKRMLLDSIMHPIIKDEIIKEINESDGLVFIDVPLLYETGLDTLCDYVILVYVDKVTQINRLCIRDNIDNSYALAKIDSQMKLDDKLKLADFVVDNSNSIIDTLLSVDNVLERIR